MRSSTLDESADAKGRELVVAVHEIEPEMRDSRFRVQEFASKVIEGKMPHSLFSRYELQAMMGARWAEV